MLQPQCCIIPFFLSDSSNSKTSPLFSISVGMQCHCCRKIESIPDFLENLLYLFLPFQEYTLQASSYFQSTFFFQVLLHINGLFLSKIFLSVFPVFRDLGDTMLNLFYIFIRLTDAIQNHIIILKNFLHKQVLKRYEKF